MPLRWPRRAAWTLTVLLALAALFYPTDLRDYRPRKPDAPALARGVEHYGRHLNTLLQVGLPLVMRDLTGLKQLLIIGATAGGTVHVLKRVLNDVEVGGTRLGRRPHSTDSKQNMPSGHSSLAASGAWFVARRYGMHYLWLLGPMTLMTMYARVALDAHTFSATLAGALLGLLITIRFTTRFSRPSGLPYRPPIHAQADASRPGSGPDNRQTARCETARTPHPPAP